jgi:hypothetical protein
MRVERVGGAISLSIEAIRQGSVQTAAELALVRLAKELEDSETLTRPLTGLVRAFEARDLKTGLLSDGEVAETEHHIAAMQASIEARKPIAKFVMAICIGAALVSFVWLWKSVHGFGATLVLILFYACIGPFIVMFAGFIPYQLFVGVPEDKVKALTQSLERHRDLNAQVLELKNLRERLESAEATRRRIKTNIQRNRAIVDAPEL